jgi:polyisoprenoid-binding protein YceI
MRRRWGTVIEEIAGPETRLRSTATQAARRQTSRKEAMPTQLETDKGIVRVPSGTWIIDKAHSSIEFRVKHMMISTVRGHFTDFEGTIEAAPDYHDSKVRTEIRTASIDTNEPRRDEHLRSADFFDADQHPTIRFESTDVEHLERGNYRVNGNLTLRGETRPVNLEVTVHGVLHDHQGPDRAGLEVRGTISRSEFGLRWQQALEAGGVMVGDEIRITADLSAVRESSTES